MGITECRITGGRVCSMSADEARTVSVFNATSGESADSAAETTSAVETVGEHPIVFFDGVCGLCNRTVDFLLERDGKRVLRFAPLQGTTARSLLTPDDVTSVGSLVFWDGGRCYRRSAATVRILWRLGGLWRLLGTALWLVPLPLRDLGYRLVAANRYRWFGQHETCRMPTPEERGRFLP